MLLKPELLVPLALFCIASLVTPGPNNFMMMSSGLNFGLRRSLPHMAGVVLGFPFLVLCVGIGLGEIFKLFPVVYTILKYACAAYMLYLAWKVATSNPHNLKVNSAQRPLTFMQATLFQWVNPKAWIMAISTISTYDAIASYPFNILIVVMFYFVFGIASSFVWAGLGSGLQYLLKHPGLVRAFNIFMAIILVASIYPVFKE